MAEHIINIPENLSFRDYLEVVQVARTWADGYDRKDPSRLLASLSPTLTIDYTGVVPTWGPKTYTRHDFITLWLSPEHLGLEPLATQHLLSLPLFKSVSDREIVVEWQIIASHGRRAEGEDGKNPMAKVEVGGESHHRGFLEHVFVRGERGGEGEGDGDERRWRISIIRPSVIFQPGDFMRVRRPVGT